VYLKLFIQVTGVTQCKLIFAQPKEMSRSKKTKEIIYIKVKYFIGVLLISLEINIFNSGDNFSTGVVFLI